MSWLKNWFHELVTPILGPKPNTGVQFEVVSEGLSDIGSRSQTVKWQQDAPIKVTIEDLSGNSNVRIALIGSRTKKFRLTISKLLDL